MTQTHAPLLRLDKVSVRYGGHIALSNVDLAVPPGRVTGLIGPNGAGKTTLFNVVTGLLAPHGGQVWLGERDLAGVAPYGRARLGLARTFQMLELFGQLTVHENVRLAARLRRRWTRERIDEVGVADRLLSRVGLDHLSRARADSLPTGQGRLVELARALATRPRVLLLDEPASGQDARETEAFGALLRELAAEGIAVLLVEHDMSLVMDVCEHIYVLDFGQLMAQGQPEAIQADPNVRAAYLGRAEAVT